MVTVHNKNFNLKQIALSGQCFRMNIKDDNNCVLISGDRYLKAEQYGDEILLHCSKAEYKDYWEDYFDLKTDYGKIINAIDPKDGYLTEAARFGRGIRILRQDLWETIISFLISQQNNITRIRRCVSYISEKYGRKLYAPDRTEYFSFPAPEPLAALEPDALMDCNLGYRSKYVVRCARDVCEGRFELDALRRMDYDAAFEYLKSLYGVGGKVADCICLFGLHLTQAFPVDTHIKQVFEANYKDSTFPFERYEGFAGILQQYMFFYDLNKREV